MSQCEIFSVLSLLPLLIIKYCHPTSSPYFEELHSHLKKRRNYISVVFHSVKQLACVKTKLSSLFPSAYFHQSMYIRTYRPCAVLALVAVSTFCELRTSRAAPQGGTTN
jgi:hypothetical protein